MFLLKIYSVYQTPLHFQITFIEVTYNISTSKRARWERPWLEPYNEKKRNTLSMLHYLNRKKNLK